MILKPIRQQCVIRQSTKTYKKKEMFINKHCGLFEGIQILDWKPKSSCSKDKRYVLDPFPCRKRKKNFHNWKNKYKDKSRPFGYRKKMNAKSSKLHCFICKKQGY